MIWSRLILAALLEYLGVRFIKRKQPKRKKLWLALLGVAVLALVVVSEIFPPENRFVTFSTPEDAIQYRSGKKRDYLLRVDGQETTLLFYREKDSTLVIETAEKRNDGWKMSNGLGSFPFAGGFIDIGENRSLPTTFVFEGKDTYLELTATEGDKITFSDNRNSDFQQLDDQWIAYVGTADGYVLTVNGKNYTPVIEKEFVGYFVTWAER